jgi:hypothetical protein
MTARDTLRDALLDYAWLGDAERQTAEVACIMGHPDVMLDCDAIETAAGNAHVQEGGTEPADWAVSTLYETHDFGTCPHRPNTAGA